MITKKNLNSQRQKNCLHHKTFVLHCESLKNCIKFNVQRKSKCRTNEKLWNNKCSTRMNYFSVIKNRWRWAQKLPRLRPKKNFNVMIESVRNNAKNVAKTLHPTYLNCTPAHSSLDCLFGKLLQINCLSNVL